VRGRRLRLVPARPFRVFAGILLIAAAAASMSITPRRTIELVDDGGAAAHPGYVAYEYLGHRPNPVHPVTYRARPLALARSDATGRVLIPTAFHMHAPFPVKTHPSLRIALVYVPRLHNAWGQLSDGAPSRPGIFTITVPGRRAQVADLSDRPALWEGTLRNVASLIHQLVSRPAGEPRLQDVDPATAALTVELIDQFRDEYDAFLSRYRDVIRTRPEMPAHIRWSSAEEQRRWTEMIDADLTREPRWGPLIARLFADELRVFEQYHLELAATSR
jgi:hypothetical protein